MEHRADIVDLSRLLLLAAATDPEKQPLVAESIAGAGRRNLILGGAELVIIAGLVLNAIQMCIPRERTEEFTLEQRPDGSSVTSIRKKVTYRVSGRAAKMVRSIMPSGAETPSAEENA